MTKARQYFLRALLERRENAFARYRRGLEPRKVHVVQLRLQLLDRNHVRQVAFVVLHHHRNGGEIESVLAKVLFEVAKRLDVLLHLALLAVRHEYHAVDALKHQFARGVVVDLPRNGVEMEPRVHAGDLAEVERKKVEKERPVALRGYGGEVATMRVGYAGMDHLQVGRLAGKTRAVVDDLAVDLPGRKVYLNHSPDS